MKHLYRSLLVSFLLVLGMQLSVAKDAPALNLTKEDLHGTWAMDLQAVMRVAMQKEMAERSADMPPEQAAMMEQMVEQMLAGMPKEVTMTFAADGTAKIISPDAGAMMGAGEGEAEKSSTATWEFVSIEGNTMTIMVTPAEKDEAPEEMKMRFLSRDEFVPDDGEELPEMLDNMSFKRKVAE